MAGALRNTNDWYDGQDALALVDPELIRTVVVEAGVRVLDLGCGLGGYSAVLNQRGRRCTGIDINPRYVARAQELGVDARTFDGTTIPFEDDAFDSTIAIEVLEHVADPKPLLREIRRVTRGAFIATVPNCTQSFGGAGVVFEHMLDADHKNFFTTETFGALLRSQFGRVELTQIAPVNAALASQVLPPKLAKLYRLLLRAKMTRPTHFFRLLARCHRATASVRANDATL